MPCRVLRLGKDYEHNLNIITTAKKSIPSIVIKQVKWSLPTTGNVPITGEFTNEKLRKIHRYIFYQRIESIRDYTPEKKLVFYRQIMVFDDNFLMGKMHFTPLKYSPCAL